MRYLIGAILLFASPVFALETGGRYDFFCDHGQDIFNAELAGEDAKYYYVKLSVSVSKLAIEKKTVLRTTLKAPPPAAAAPKTGRRIVFGVLGGLGLASGRLADFAALSPAATVFATYRQNERWSIVGRADFLRFASGNAALRFLSFSAGLRFDPAWQFPGFRIFSALSLGSALVSASSEDFSEQNFAPVVIFCVGAERNLTEKLSAVATVDASYIYDKQTFVLVPALRLGVSYRL